MSEKIIVLVTSLDNAASGEISVVENPETAARLVESLLESGLEEERVRVFTGAELQMHVQRKPVVSLMSSDLPVEKGADQSAPIEPDQEEEPQAVNARARSKLAEEGNAEPFVKNGVRFSSLFRPA